MRMGDFNSEVGEFDYRSVLGPFLFCVYVYIWTADSWK